MQPALEKRWHEAYARLTDYYALHGDSNVPQAYITLDGFKLGAWVNTQRYAYKQNRMSDERYKQLKKLDFPFYVYAGRTYKACESSEWNKGFLRLKEYLEVNGDTLVPKRYECPEDGFPLGRWVGVQRFSYANHRLSSEREDRLRSIGFVFRAATGNGYTGPLSYEWMEGFNNLKQYITEHGNAAVPVDYVCPDNGFRLGMWVFRQRRAYKTREMPSERQEKLQSIGFIICVRKGRNYDSDNESYVWEKGYSHLLDYCEEYGNAMVPTDYICPNDNYALGNWVNGQRFTYRKQKLSQSRYQLLKDLGFVFAVREGANHYEDTYCWKNGIEHLAEYIKTYGNSIVRNDYHSPDGYALGAWIKAIRRRYKNGHLSLSQITALEETSFSFYSRRTHKRPR